MRIRQNWGKNVGSCHVIVPVMLFEKCFINIQGTEQRQNYAYI
jgi:hypothetical protein